MDAAFFCILSGGSFCRPLTSAPLCVTIKSACIQTFREEAYYACLPQFLSDSAALSHCGTAGVMPPPAACRGKLYAYLDFGGPTGTSRDALAEGMLALAAEKGRLAPGQPVVEASSGAFGMALALAD